jgi:hypothetical protein
MMTRNAHRERGRPPGTGTPDQPALAKVAELLLDDPSLRPTTAIKRVIGTKNESNIRRLQVKWKAGGQVLLAQARERRERQQKAAAAWLDPATMQLVRERLGAWTEREAQAQLGSWLNPSPEIRALLNPSPEIRALMDSLKPSPAMQAMIDATRPSREMQAIIDSMCHPSPEIRAALEQVDRQKRELEQFHLLDVGNYKPKPF